VAAEAHHLSHAGQAHRPGVGGNAPQLASLNAAVVFVQCAGLRGKWRTPGILVNLPT
jgi:hypothetical protein